MISRLFAAVLFLAFATAATAQTGFDVTAVTANPETKLFSNGRTTVAAYVLTQLEDRTNCCGPDDIYVEIKYDANGKVTGTRVLSSTNECNRRSLPDILQHITWEVSDPNTIRPVYLALKPVIECAGTANDNVYQPVPAPQGAGQPMAQNNTPEPEQMADNNGWGDDGDAGNGNAWGDADNNDQGNQEQMMADNQSGQDHGDMDHDHNHGDMDHDHGDQGDQDHGDQMMMGGPNQDGDDMQAGGPTGPEGVEMLPANLPDQTVSAVTGEERAPDESHRESHMNSSGPRLSTNFAMTRSAAAVRIKKELRSAGICGLAHFWVEITLTKNGDVKALRFFNVNSEEVKTAAAEAMANMRFQANTPNQNYTIFEFKTFIDCENRQVPYDLNEVADYFYGPGEQNPNRGQQLNGGNGESLGVPRDR